LAAAFEGGANVAPSALTPISTWWSLVPLLPCQVRHGRRLGGVSRSLRSTRSTDVGKAPYEELIKLIIVHYQFRHIPVLPSSFFMQDHIICLWYSVISLGTRRRDSGETTNVSRACGAPLPRRTLSNQHCDGGVRVGGGRAWRSLHVDNRTRSKANPEG
jgi:hypothetical protein